MKKYMSVLRMKFLGGMQYRVAALAGMATQFAWGGLLVLLYRAFYQSNPAQFTMTMQETSSYIWMQQAFLMMFMSWRADSSIYDMITDGNVAYELVRPMSVYSLWFARNMGLRLSGTLLRCVPVLIFASCLPVPYGIVIPDWGTALLFLISILLAANLAVAITMLSYVMTFYTMSAQGVRILFQTLCDVFTGSLIPLPFMPDAFQRIVKLLPFGYMQDVPLRIFSGNIAGQDMLRQLGGQVLWLIILVTAGELLMRRALKRVTVQGG